MGLSSGEGRRDAERDEALGRRMCGGGDLRSGHRGGSVYRGGTSANAGWELFEEEPEAGWGVVGGVLCTMVWTLQVPRTGVGKERAGFAGPYQCSGCRCGRQQGNRRRLRNSRLSYDQGYDRPERKGREDKGIQV